MASEHCSKTDDGMLRCDAAGGKSGDLRLVCGVVMASFAGTFGFLDQGVEPIAEDLSSSPVVRQAFAAMLDEIASHRLGTRAVTSALMKICLLKAIQSHFDTSGIRKMPLACLRVPHLQKAVAAIQDRPEAPYNVAMLADIAGMSRSAFACEFLKTFATTPMKFVTTTRLHHAAELLRSTTISVKVIAASIGFSSRSHFSHAFRDAYGIDPRNFRRKIVTPGPDALNPPARDERASIQGH